MVRKRETVEATESDAQVVEDDENLDGDMLETEPAIARSSSGRKQRSSLQRRVPDKPSTFTALLMNGVTYEFLGMKFRKNVPRDVPMKYLKKFRSNGWFQVSGV